MFFGAVLGLGALLHSRQRSHGESKALRPTSVTRRAVAKDETSEVLPFVTLTNAAGDSVKVYPFGACIASYIKGGKEVLGMRKDTTFDGKKPIGGGIPICFPQFGPGPSGLQHGFARSMNWSIAETADGKEPRVVLKLTDNADTRSQWDHAFEATYTITLAATGLEAVFNVKNTGSSSLDFTAALHSYWNVSHPSNIKVVGDFGGKTYTNKVPPEPGSEMANTIGNQLEFGKEYTLNLYRDTSGDVVMHDSGDATSLALNITGWSDTAIWSPKGDDGMGWTGFIGIEPAQFFSPVQLSPAAEWTGKLEVMPSR
jgi:glucose-6-phosphate 1-epimerase